MGAAFTAANVKPAIGPTDTFPPNNMDISTSGGSSNLQAISGVYDDFLPTAETTQFDEFGFYTSDLAGGAKIAVLNPMPAYILNPYATTMKKDPGEQLKKLDAFLSANPKTIVVSPIGLNDMATIYSILLYAILVKHRVGLTISAHSGNSFLQVIKADTGTPPWNSLGVHVGSISPNGYRNPSYTVIEYDTGDISLSSYKVRYIDLKASKTANAITWAEYTSYQSDMGMAGLTAVHL